MCLYCVNSQGYPARLTKELNGLYKHKHPNEAQTVKIKVVAPHERQFSAWIGGKIGVVVFF